MFGIGPGELLLIFLIALFVLGPERLPSTARDLGKAMNELRKVSDELTREFLNADQARPASTPAVPPVAPEPPVAVEPPVAPAAIEASARGTEAPPPDRAVPEPEGDRPRAERPESERPEGERPEAER